MGQQLFLTEATIKTHLSAIYRKLNASNRTQALSIAFENNLVQQ
jgi:DNA-binding NarL/FixJ family response regulator